MISFQRPAPSVTPRPHTTVLLIRHAATDAMNARLTGRLAGVALNPTGERQAASLAAALVRLPLTAIYSSPLARARATAAPLASAFRLPVITEHALIEINFGEWTGLTFAELSADRAWQMYNAARSVAPVPGGESPLAASARIAAVLDRLHHRHPGETIAAITHAELVRYALLRARRLPIDRWAEIEVPAASVTVLECGATQVRELHAAWNEVSTSS
jgi:probable phosphoglycerate mutase